MLKINYYYSLFIAIVLSSNNCLPLFSTIRPLQKICNGLGEYYKQMNRNNYYDDNGVGLFSKWFEEQEMDADDIEEELQDDNHKNCSYLRFDENFPLNKIYDNDDEKEKGIFNIIQNCYKYGESRWHKSQAKKSATANSEDNKEEKSNDASINQKKHGKLDDLKQLKAKGINIGEIYTESKNALHEACSQGNLKVAKLLFNEGKFDPKAKDEDGNNALHLACLFSSNVEMIAWLLDSCKMNIETKGSNQLTPFLCVALKGQLAIARLLKQRGANTNAKDEHGDNALHLACRYSKSLAMITWLLDVCKIPIKTKGQYQMTPFLCAAEKGKLKIAKRLKERGADIKVKDEDKNNALHYACLFSGSLPMVNWLLDVCKISIETKGEDQTTPFLHATAKGQLPIAKLLRKRGANINAKNEDGNNALHLACLYSGSVEMVTWLLHVCEISIETKGEYGRTPFFYTAREGSLAIAKFLKQRGANVNIKDEDGDNVLHYACLSGSVEMVTWLLHVCKIGIESRGPNQMTPFLYASVQGQLPIAKLLKQRGANINATDAQKGNALHLACLASASVPMVRWLLDVCKIGLEAKGEYQRTPFLCAAQKGQLAIAKLLKKQGANINAKDKDGNNALHTACLYSSNVEMITWLLGTCSISIETKGYNQRTPFLCAAEKGRLSTAKLLKQRKANIKAKSEHGNNALHLACLFSGSENMVTWLLDTCKIGLETKGYHQRTPFLCAVKKGRLSIAKLLKKRKANIKAKNEHGDNALHVACLYSGSKAMITWLLDICKISIEAKRQSQKTPFLCAVEAGQLGIAKLLKERGANIKAKEAVGNNALHLACLFLGSEAMVTWLLDVCQLPIEGKGCVEKTPFLCAAQEGKLSIAKLLKQRRANSNATDKTKVNALHYASAFSGSVAMITWLLNVCKIPIEVKAIHQKTPFLFAASGGQLEIAKLLKKRGANINAKDAYGNNALHLACLFSDSEAMTSWLLDICKICLESRGQNQMTPFLCTAEEGQLAIANLLKQKGANINAKNEYGDNALHLACLSSSNEAMVTWLLDVCKISLETKGQYQNTPFLSAAHQGQLDIAKRLKKRGANSNAKDENGNNALHLACIAPGSEDMVTWLLDICKIKLESQGQNQMTSFLCAAHQGQLGIAKLLRERGANVDVKEENGNNALHLACFPSGSEAMVTWLLDICKIGLESQGQNQITPFLCAVCQGQLAIAKLLRKRGANIHAKDKNGNNALYCAKNYSNNKEMISYVQKLGFNNDL